MSKNNLSVRQELAALYRILDMYGMTDLANQCAAARSSDCLLYTSPSPRDRG